MKSFTPVTIAVALLVSTANAFWRMPCRGRTDLARIDPIVDPGEVSSHAHTLHGGSNIGESTTYDLLRASDCTSCQFTDDKSAYWTPSLHFICDNGTTVIVEQIGGMLAYYDLFGLNLKAFPAGFRMLAGDTSLRNFTGPVPDPPLAEWQDSDRTQLLLGQKSIGFNCLNYAILPPEPSRYRHFMPTHDYMDEHCTNGIRTELMFPSCWDGQHLDSPDHKSHMAYPDEIDGGKCPPGFDVRLPTLFYETIWNTYAFKGVGGQFVLSNGDPTGYGYHGDFMSGWDVNVLQSAVDTCNSTTGMVEDCPVFTSKLQTEQQQKACKVQDKVRALDDENCAGPSEGLCGNVPIQYGPGYATPIKPAAPGGQPTAAPVLQSPASVPTLSYATPRASVTDRVGGGVSIYDVKTSDAPDAIMTYEPDVVAAAQPSSSSDAAPVAAPAVTSPAVIQSDADGNIISRTTYTSAGTVYVVAVKEVDVTVTADAYKKMHRRQHGHQHAHGLLRGW